jgi:hypothetical protein
MIGALAGDIIGSVYEFRQIRDETFGPAAMFFIIVPGSRFFEEGSICRRCGP